MEPVKVQLCETISDFGAEIRNQQMEGLIGVPGMQGMFATDFLCVINLHGALKNVNESM